MRRWHFIVIGISLIFSTLLLVLVRISPNMKERIIYAYNIGEETEESSTKSVCFEIVDSVQKQSEDITISGNTVEFIRGDGLQRTNFAKGSVDEKLVSMSESEAWQYLTDGLIDDYPTVPYKEIKDIVQMVYNNHATQITVPVWYWENPEDVNDLSKVTKYVTITIHDKLADTYEYIFMDIYKDPSKPVFNLNDYGMGTWVLRGKNHSEYNTVSAHALGTAIDINPSSGSYEVDGVIYGNSYGAKKMPYSIWKDLPETHTKYHVLYEDCPIVSIFKSYGFYWGGDWTSGTDCMHLAFLGDYMERSTGYENYLKYGGK